MKRQRAFAAALLDFRTSHGSRRGAKGPENQDACLVRHPSSSRHAGGVLCAVADGVGGLQDGARASRKAVEALAAAYDAGRFSRRDPGPDLRNAVVEAHDQIREMPSPDPPQRAGGEPGAWRATTVVAALLKGEEVWVASAGDSRAYFIHPDGRIEQVTEDHSWVQEQVRAGLLTPEEAAIHPQRHVITRFLGGPQAPEVDLFHRELSPGSFLVLCSDGLVDVATDQEIARIVAAQDPEQSVPALLRLAAERNAHDDVTVCVAAAVAASQDRPSRHAFVTGAPDFPLAPHPAAAPAPRRSRPALLALIVMAAGLLAAAALWSATDQRITPGVSVAGAPVGNLSPDEASSRIITALTPVLTCPQSLRAAGREWVRTPAELGLWVDAESTAARASAIGHRGSLVQQAAERIRAATSGANIDPVLRVEPVVLRQAMRVIGAELSPDSGLRLDPERAAASLAIPLAQSPCRPLDLPVEPRPSPPAPPASEAQP